MRVRQGGEVWQFGQRDIHPKRARPATPVFHPPPESFGQGTRLNEMEVEKLGVDPRGDGCGTDGFTRVSLNAYGATILKRTRRTRVESLISAPRAAAAFAMAWVIAPMPPIAWPQTPFLPFTSPKLWCRRT